TNTKAPPSGDLVEDCRIMLRFALKEANAVPDELRSEIKELDEFMINHRLPPISALPAELVPKPREEASGEQASDMIILPPTDLIIKVHSGLSKVVAPATALSLQTSEPPPGRHRFLGGMPLIVKLASLMALLFAIGFVVTVIPTVEMKLKPQS